MNSDILKSGNKIHFIGIGGISMSALAKILINDGCIISGSDIAKSPLTDSLEKLGAKISIGHFAENITDQDLVVNTAAVHDDNPEMIRAKELGITVVERAELLGAIMSRYNCPIAISGTHGKTSTTGMVSQIFLTAEKEPTITIGGELDSIGGNLKVGKKDYFLAEACEYHRSFLQFLPRYSLILNIEADHLDYFSGLEEIISVFREFALKTPDNGAVIYNADDKNTCTAVSGIDRKTVSFGIKNECDYRAIDIQYDNINRYSFTVLKNNAHYMDIRLSVPGKHSVYNALAAIAVADLCSIEKETIEKGIGEFIGAHRRFEHKGYYKKTIIIDDYAHHPSEIKTTLEAADKMDFEKVWCVFQPHTYTRTKTLFDDFVKVFEESSANVIITDIFAAREKDDGSISSKNLADAIDKAIYLKTFADVESFLKENAGEKDMIITMGAGNVYKIGENLINEV